MPAAIDTLKFAKRLRQANFTEPQAEALAEAVAEATIENVATRQDIGELRAEIAELRAELKQDIADLRAELKLELADLRAETKREIASLRLEMAALELRLLRWMGAGFVATIAVLAAVIQFAHR